jgi:antibiotic biosynthesis monooxygenase (ABM) superfamily enzyme
MYRNTYQIYSQSCTFAAMNSSTPQNKWKLLLLNWLFVYPLINVLITVTFPLTEGWPMPLRTLILTAIMVPVMGMVLPKLHLRFAGLLRK